MVAQNTKEVQYGTVKGTGKKLVLICGFRPKRVELSNGTALCRWASGMKQDSDKTTNGGYSRTKTAIRITKVGFEIGTDTDINIDGTDINWVAYPA